MGEMIETKANIFMHSFCCLSCDTFIVTSKASSPLTAIQCFLFQFPATFRFINIIQQLLTSSSSSSSHFHPSTFPSKACFRRQFLSKMWPTQLPFLLLFFVRCSFPPRLYVTILYFFTQSVQLIFSIIVQHYIPKWSRYFWSTFRSVQVSAPHKVMLQMRHVTSSSWNLSPIYWWKESSSCWTLLLPWQSWV